jgi:NADH dehydrogenase [ubiquinone] 1 alpha subcomplex assembly factor 7
VTKQSREDGLSDNGLLRRQEPPRNDEGKSLEKIIRNIISLNGSLSVEAYWNLCLSHPEYGYYITRDPLGRAGDFTTAPEISQLFGEMIGIWAVEQWVKLGGPKAMYIVECGPGRGTLMADLLRIGKVVPEFIKAIQIHLIETSPALRAKQGEALKGYQLVWHEDLSTLPDNAPLLLIGNEFLDALPIQQYVFKDGQWFERVIGVEADELVFGLCPTPSPLIPLPEGRGKVEVFEISPARENYILDISARIQSQTGAGLIIDYGHDVSWFGDTLQAVKNHHYTDILKNCGEADITSHVDFGRLKTIIEKTGLSVSLQSQGDFLRRMGIEERAEQLIFKSTSVETDLHRLIDDDKMGQLFRVMEF